MALHRPSMSHRRQGTLAATPSSVVPVSTPLRDKKAIIALLTQGLRRCARAQDTVEYVLLVLLIALATTAGILIFADALGASYQEASECLPIPGKGPADDVPGIGPPDCKGGRQGGS